MAATETLISAAHRAEVQEARHSVSIPAYPWKTQGIPDGWVVKRVFDVVFSFSVLLLTAPLFVLIALLVKLTSEGPVFFRQERVGQFGRRFILYKFRTMRHNAGDELHKEYFFTMVRSGKSNGKVYKLVDDPRITPVGRVLRRLSLDELPQFINVLKGEMSLIGPRPPIPYETEVYKPWHWERFQVKPGLTGLWQVSGRNLLPFEKQMELDIRYVREWSWALDLMILVKTPFVVLTGEGAY